MKTPAWQRTEPEAPINPEIPIIDPHQHFWWAGPLFDLSGRFLPEDYLVQIRASGHRFIASVYLECGTAYREEGPEALRCVGETEYVDAVPKPSDVPGLCAAIVGHASLSSGASVEEVLAAHLDASPRHFRGVREMLGSDPDFTTMVPVVLGLASTPTFREGFACLDRFGLSFDTWCVHPQLDDIVQLARAFPGTAIILNHLGTPMGIGRFAGKRQEAFAQWCAGIDALATCPNVYLKLGGLAIRFTGNRWEEDDMPPDSSVLAEAYRPCVTYAVEALSPSRCMFESNFPIDGRSHSFSALWNAFKRIAGQYSMAEQQQLFGETARRAYRLAL